MCWMAILGAFVMGGMFGVAAMGLAQAAKGTRR